MAKILRICLAMGGGVSLGSFSGSSLTEALKLLILYGKDENGNCISIMQSGNNECKSVYNAEYKTELLNELFAN